MKIEPSGGGRGNRRMRTIQRARRCWHPFYSVFLSCHLLYLKYHILSGIACQTAYTRLLLA